MDKRSPAAEVVPISDAIDARHVEEVAELQEIEKLPMAQLRKKQIRCGVDPGEIGKNARETLRRIQSDSPRSPKNGLS